MELFLFLFYNIILKMIFFSDLVKVGLYVLAVFGCGPCVG